MASVGVRAQTQYVFYLNDNFLGSNTTTPTTNFVPNASVTSTYAGTTITLKDGSTVTLPAHDTGKIGAIGTVFGGGNEAKVVGNTNVNIGTLMGENIVFVTPEAATEAERTKTVLGADIKGNVFGGGNNAEVEGNAKVVVGKDQ